MTHEKIISVGRDFGITFSRGAKTGEIKQCGEWQSIGAARIPQTISLPYRLHVVVLGAGHRDFQASEFPHPPQRPTNSLCGAYPSRRDLSAYWWGWEEENGTETDLPATRPPDTHTHLSILLSQSHCISLALVSDEGQECNSHCNKKASSQDQSRQSTEFTAGHLLTGQWATADRQPSNIAQNMLTICCRAF